MAEMRGLSLQESRAKVLFKQQVEIQQSQN
jgi:hypothetical protein